jgi:adenylylsulfate kinase
MSKNGFVIWFTGLPGAGKSTLATAVAKEIEARGLPTECIDSGALRKSLLDNTLGFSKAHRDANCRRNAFAARVLARNGVVAIVSSVSPYRATREAIRAEIASFVEVYVSTPKAVCVDRDDNGMWSKALAGEVRGFTGVDDPYEPPEAPEVNVDTTDMSVIHAARKVILTLEALSLLQRKSASVVSREEDKIRERLRTLGYVD